MQLTMFDRAPTVAVDDVRLLLGVLRGAGWVNAKLLARLTGYDDRKLRAVANASDGRVISGNAGYKLTKEATNEEINECVGRLKAQADKMVMRIVSIERARHYRA